MPRLLEVGLACRDFKVSPEVYGYDMKDPRTTRAIRMALSVYDTALSRKQANKKTEWDKSNPDGKRFLGLARNGKSDREDELGPNEVRLEIPERPKD